jgi:CO/xanthine dehydrogenase Mo-binding subunit
MALHEGMEFVNGLVRDTNLGTYMPLRIAEVPELDISFVESGEVPVGLGEPATTVAGPAIGNLCSSRRQVAAYSNYRRRGPSAIPA